MSPEEWARLRAEFEVLEELPAAERESRLAQVAGSSPTLAFELRRLLAAADAAGQRVLDVSIPERLAALGPSLEGDPAPARDLAGVVLKERYRIESLLGSGGSNEVWLARDELLAGRTVVVKLPHTILSGEGFQAEVAALAKVHHPGIAHPLDSGTMEDGTLFLVLEWVEGRSLREMMQREGGRLDREVALQVIGEVAEALDEVHRAGVLHLDVKPENVMVKQSARGVRAVLVDFGIARLQGRDGAEASLRGSPRYMAPERFAGVESPAADMYGLGVLALEMLSGQTELAGAVKLRPAALREALVPALEREPDRRPASAGGWASELRRASGAWKRRWGWIAVAVAAIALLAGYLEYERRGARAAELGQMRDALTRKSLLDAIAGLDSLGGNRQSEQIVSLWSFVASDSKDAAKLETAAEILVVAGMQYGHPGRRHLGRSGDAEATLRKAILLADKAAALAPERWQGKKLAGQSRDALGSVLIEMGRYQDAEKVLLDGLKSCQGAVGVEGIRAGLLGSLSRIAFHNRDWPLCLRLRNELVDVRHDAWAAHQEEMGYGSDYGGALAARGYLLREMGEYQPALRDYAESDRINGRMRVMQPRDRQPMWQLARNSLEVGRTLLMAGDAQAASQRLAKASAELRFFAGEDPSDQATARELALSLAWLGKARKQAGFAAKDWQPPVEEAVRLALAAAQHDPASAKAGENLAAVRLIAGEVGVDSGEVARRRRP